MRITLVSGTEARQRCADAGFLAAWRALVAGETKHALVQAPEFALPWYAAYAGAYEPLLVEGRAADGELLALLPLARRADGGLTHAGAEQAEYHGWLARAGRDGEFLVPALEALRAGPGCADWRWRWSPPGSDTRWTEELAARGFALAREERPAPVWELARAERLSGLLENRSTRAKFNRYRKRGELVLERVRDPARTRALLAVLARQCDFRQEVVHGVRPFASDARKLEFFVARQAFPEANHFSVLRCGDEPLAFHFGACDGRTCLYGLTSYAPHEGKHSPGTLLLIELARALTAAGYQELDLTPGSDAYKQRFATGERPLVRLAFFGARPAAWRARASGGARRVLLGPVGAELGLRAERLQRLQRGLREVRGELARRRLRGLARRAAGFVLERRALACFAPPAALRAPEGGPAVRVQAWEELLALEEPGSYPSRRVLLGESLERFTDGGVLYSVRGERGLARLAWRLAAPKGELASELARSGWLPAGGELVRLPPPLDGQHAPTLLHALLAAALAESAAPAVVALEECSAREHAFLRTLGFRPLGAARLRRLLRAPPRWQLEAAPEGAGA